MSSLPEEKWHFQGHVASTPAEVSSIFCVWIKSHISSHRKTTYNTTRGVFQQQRDSQEDWRQAVTLRVSVSQSSPCSASAVAAELMLVACYDRLSVFLLAHNRPVQVSALFFSYLNVLNHPGLTTNTLMQLAAQGQFVTLSQECFPPQLLASQPKPRPLKHSGVRFCPD